MAIKPTKISRATSIGLMAPRDSPKINFLWERLLASMEIARDKCPYSLWSIKRRKSAAWSLKPLTPTSVPITFHLWNMLSTMFFHKMAQCQISPIWYQAFKRSSLWKTLLRYLWQLPNRPHFWILNLTPVIAVVITSWWRLITQSSLRILIQISQQTSRLLMWQLM